MRFIAPTYALIYSVSLPLEALACSVCFGDPNSAQQKAVAAGVWFLMGSIVFLLICFAGFFIYLKKKATSTRLNRSGDIS